MTETKTPSAPNFLIMMLAQPGERCPGCKRRNLVASDHIKEDGYPEPIMWACVKCPDEHGCGFARAA